MVSPSGEEFGNNLHLCFDTAISSLVSISKCTRKSMKTYMHNAISGNPFIRAEDDKQPVVKLFRLCFKIHPCIID